MNDKDNERDVCVLCHHLFAFFYRIFFCYVALLGYSNGLAHSTTLFQTNHISSLNKSIATQNY